MRVPEIPLIPIPPATELKHQPRSVLKEVYDKQRADNRVGGDSLSFSPEAQAFEASRELVKSVLAELERGFEDQREQYAIGSREEFDARLEAQEDASPNATAQLILGGITGYIFAAFQEQNQDLTAGDLEKFREQAKAGVRRGYEEAKTYLQANQMFGQDIQGNAEETVRQVLEGVDDFVDAALEKYGFASTETAEGGEAAPAKPTTTDTT